MCLTHGGNAVITGVRMKVNSFTWVAVISLFFLLTTFQRFFVLRCTCPHFLFNYRDKKTNTKCQGLILNPFSGLYFSFERLGEQPRMINY